MVKKIYLVRHGQTDFNRRGIVQGGGIDPSLNEVGRRQAVDFYHTFRHIPFDALYTSTLRRSIESIKSFIELKIPHHALSDFNEIDWGNKEGKKITQQGNAYYRRLIKQWREGLTDICIEGGESPSQVAMRQRRSIYPILRKSDEKTILICMHGRAMRILLCQLMGYPLSKMDVFLHRNMGLYLLHYTGSMCRIEKFNNVDHLRD